MRVKMCDVLWLSDLLPEDEEFVPVPDALLYQVEQQHHFGRVLQDARLVVAHDVLRLAAEKEERGTAVKFITFTWMDRLKGRLLCCLANNFTN